VEGFVSQNVCYRQFSCSGWCAWQCAARLIFWFLIYFYFYFRVFDFFLSFLLCGSWLIEHDFRSIILLMKVICDTIKSEKFSA
jgi:hypothetical protein